MEEVEKSKTSTNRCMGNPIPERLILYDARNSITAECLRFSETLWENDLRKQEIGQKIDW